MLVKLQTDMQPGSQDTCLRTWF